MLKDNISELMTITQGEKQCIKTYFMYLESYISKEHAQYLPTEMLPDGNKRFTASIKLKRWNENFGTRTLLVPREEDAMWEIPLLYLLEEDPAEHSCTVVDSKMYFHSNRADTHPSYPFYYKRSLSVAERCYQKIVVKHLENFQGERFVLRSVTSDVKKHATSIHPMVKAQTSFYLATMSFFHKLTASDLVYKSLTITPFLGETLTQRGMMKHLDLIEKDQFVSTLLWAYIDQIYDKGLVHTDIKPCNVCLKEDGEGGIVVTFIDFNEAFINQQQQVNGLGTRGYYAPEFFLYPEDCKQQLQADTVSEMNKPFISRLKPLFRQLFSQSTDLYALGEILLADIKLSEDSRYYDMACKMVSSPESRISPKAFKAELSMLDLQELFEPGIKMGSLT